MAEQGYGRGMTHEDVFLDLRTCEMVALCVGSVEFVEVDGEFLSRTFPYADNHLGGDVQLDVSDACYAFYLLDADKFFSHFLLGQLGARFWGADQRLAPAFLVRGSWDGGYVLKEVSF